MSNLDNINPPVIINEPGTLHPINQTKDYLLKLLSEMGFTEVYGPEIETEEFNFDMLNIKKSHPARQMHDTFYAESKKNVLRTHTSSPNKKHAKK
jgi:phenylalanyl-tRNA synthetase alpha chain